MKLQLLALLTVPSAVLAQAPAGASTDPRWVVEQFFFAVAWPEKARYYTGEMQEHYAETKTIGEYGAAARRASLRTIAVDSATAVHAVQVLQGERIEDWYAHLLKSGSGWQLAAVRTLALPPLFFMILDSLEAVGPLPDSVAALRENMRLVASSDSALKAFFAAHLDGFQTIARGFARETVRSIATAPDGLKAPTQSLQLLPEHLRSLDLRGAWRDSEFAECVFVEIGGMIDNEVGFMHCATDASVPRMTPERFILIERVAPGWYLYKTT